jgi:hypothetical protein
VLLSLERIAAKYDYGIKADPEVIARSVEKLQRLESLPFGDAKQLYWTVSMAVARGDEWGFTGETASALLIARDSLRESMRATAENEGKSVEYETAERMFLQHIDDFHNPEAPLNARTKPGDRGWLLRTLLKDPMTLARIAKAMEQRGIDITEIKNLFEKYRDPEDLKKDIRDAARLEVLGEKEFSRQQGAATRKAVLRWTVKALSYAALTLAAIWILAALVRWFGK